MRVTTAVRIFAAGSTMPGIYRGSLAKAICEVEGLRVYGFQRFLAAAAAISRRRSVDNFAARAAPPALPPLDRFGVELGLSLISPVAIRPTMTAALTTSAGRFSPRGPFGIGLSSCRWRHSTT